MAVLNKMIFIARFLFLACLGPNENGVFGKTENYTHAGAPGFQKWFEEIWNEDSSDIDISDFEDDDDDVKDPSFAPLDLQCESSSEEETNEKGPIVSETPVALFRNSFSEQNLSCSSTSLETPTRLKRRRKCKQSIFAASTSSSPDVLSVSSPKISQPSRRSYWKSLHSEEFNPIPPAPPYIENPNYVSVLSPEDYFMLQI